MNSTGSTLVYSTYLGGSSNDTAYGLALDTSGKIYVVGDTASTATTFPETSNAFQTAKSGGTDAFVGKLDPAQTTASNSLPYLTYFGGSGTDHGYAIAVNSSYAYITGQTGSSNLPLNNANDGTLNGLTDAFVAKFDPATSGSSGLIFSTYLGGGSRETGWGIAADSSYCYVTGEESSTIATSGSSNFIVSSGAYQLSTGNGGGSDIFVARFSSTGSFSYANTVGGSNNDKGLAIAMNGSKFVVTGEIGSDGFATSGAPQLNYQGGTDAFVLEIDPSQSGSSSLPFFTYHAGTQDDSGRGIATSGSTAYITGFTDSYSTANALDTFPVTSGVYQDDKQGGFDAFVAKFTSLP